MEVWEDGEVLEWCGRRIEMEMELVMAQEQRNQMEEECMQCFDGLEGWDQQKVK